MPHDIIGQRNTWLQLQDKMGKKVRLKDKILKVFGMNERRVDNYPGDDAESVAFSIAEVRHSDPNISEASAPMIKAAKVPVMPRSKSSAGPGNGPMGSSGSSLVPSGSIGGYGEYNAPPLAHQRSSGSSVLGAGTRGS